MDPALKSQSQFAIHLQKEILKAATSHSKRSDHHYLCIQIHTQTQSKKLISEFYHLSLSISFDFELDLQSSFVSKLPVSYTEVTPVVFKKESVAVVSVLYLVAKWWSGCNDIMYTIG